MMRSFMQKIALLSMCPVAMITALLSPTLVYIYQAYPTLSESTATLVLTISNLTVILGLILGPVLVKRFPIKYLIITGMTLFTAGNVLCAWCESFLLMVCFRAVCGIGAGMVMPLQSTFIASYPEEERATLLGFNSVASAVIVAPLAIISGIVATMNWRYSFLLYMINVVVIIMVVIFLPKHISTQPQAEKNKTAQVDTKEKAKLSEYGGVLFYYYFMMVGSYLFVTALAAELAPYLENINMGGAAESGFMVGLAMVGSLVAGLTFGKLMLTVKNMAMPLTFIGAAIAFVMLWLAPNLVVIGAAQILLGLCTAIGIMIVSFELSRALPLELFPVASAGANFFLFVLQFLAPIVCLALLDVVGGSFRTVFLIYAVIQVVMVGLALVLPKILLKNV